jgi:hypothetical protein
VTSIGTAGSAYVRVAYGHRDVAPVRATQPTVHHRTASEQSAQFAAKGQGQPDTSHTQASRTAPVNVVDLPVTNRRSVEPTIRTQQPQPYTPFLAQQIAQEELPDKSKAMRQKHAAVTEAYVTASNDSVKILGPVRPREIVV